MNQHIRYLALAALMVVCQILLSEYVNIWAILYIAIFPQFIILLPPSMNRSLHLIVAFLLGLCIDFFADGVLGLNAAALVAMAYTRPFFLKLTLSKGNMDNAEGLPLTPKTVEIPKLIMLNTLMLAVFFTAYILLDSAAGFSLWYTLLKIGICVAVNSIITIICNIVLLDKFLR